MCHGNSLLYREGMSILSGRKSVPGIVAVKGGKWKERLLGLDVSYMWIHTYKLKGHMIWDVPVKVDMSWGWRKLLQIIECAEPFFWVKIGNVPIPILNEARLDSPQWRDLYGDLFIFARGKSDSARLIMESLDEFQKSSGLVPNISKSMTYFCNVSNLIKHVILDIIPFVEGDLLVKYLGFSLISIRLCNRDCKILVEKVTNRIGDMKNKSLSFVGRLQLCRSVLSFMHVYWALVLVIPKDIILDI
nr:reverse transcriptase domain, reverse transcriptase zinc-binding domain protein [Tanacetum cinerariifolium]